MSKKMIKLFSVFFLMLIALAGCKSNEGKIIIQVETEMKVGATYRIKYELENIDESVELSWKVSDNGMAHLDKEKMTIKALKEGTFSLIVSARSGEYFSKEITIMKRDFPAVIYNITWDLNGGNWDNEKGVSEFIEGEYVNMPVPKKEGYIFTGWYQDDVLITDIIDQNYELVAKWEEEILDTKYKITYILNGGRIENMVSEYDGSEEVALPKPEFEGYIFRGWYTDPEFVSDEVTNIIEGSTGDKIFYAKWSTIEYTITFETNGGTLEEKVITYNVESPDIILPIIQKDGYEFKGWYTDSEFTAEAVTKVTAGSTGDKIFYARWEEIA